MNYDALMIRVETVGAAYLLGGNAAAGYALIVWSLIGLLTAWK